MKPGKTIGLAAALVLMLAFVGIAVGAPVVESELHENSAEAFRNPTNASGLPRVLLIGDSISIGYTDAARREMKGVAAVFRPPMNCRHTGFGLENITTWLGTNQWDVIHFNFGIWDTHLLDAKGRLLPTENQNPPPAGMHVRYTPEQYRENLTRVVKILEGTGAKLVWASSTPIMSRTGERLEAIPTLNRTAADLMKSHNIATDDLYEFVLPHAKEWQKPDQCHFNAQGNTQLGKQVAESIRRVINKKAP